MTPLEGLDFAWTKPTPAQVRANGGHWIAGYFSTDTSKNLNRGNIATFLAAGIPVVTVWETTTGRATQGHAAGVADAHAAEAERIAAGLPSSHVHHFAVDEDTSWASVAAYFDGAISVLGLARVGCYGGYPVIVGAHGHGIKYLWQTVAWSGGAWASFATIRQTGGELLGGQADVDYSEAADFGQTPRPVAPTPTPKPKPTPTPTPVPVPLPEEDTDMIMVAPDEKAYPNVKDWPGIFLLAGGKLSHVTHPADLKAFQAAGVKGPVTISVDQYNSLLAGK